MAKKNLLKNYIKPVIGHKSTYSLWPRRIRVEKLFVLMLFAKGVKSVDDAYVKTYHTYHDVHVGSKNSSDFLGYGKPDDVFYYNYIRDCVISLVNSGYMYYNGDPVSGKKNWNVGITSAGRKLVNYLTRNTMKDITVEDVGELLTHSSVLGEQSIKGKCGPSLMSFMAVLEMYEIIDKRSYIHIHQDMFFDKPEFMAEQMGSPEVQIEALTKVGWIEWDNGLKMYDPTKNLIKKFQQLFG